VILEITELSKKFQGDMVLGPINATIHPGVFSVVGSNGAGKTTLLRILAGILRPTDGSIRLDGKRLDNKYYRERMGYKPQSISGYTQTTVIEGLRYFALLKGIPQHLINDRLEWALEVFKLREYARFNLANFSRGLRQLFFLAQAMLTDPDILLLDEPFGGLSCINRLDIIRRISLWSSGRIVLISTHDISDLQ
jgi:ABC-2 type transport system ATP-binding protein